MRRAGDGPNPVRILAPGLMRPLQAGSAVQAWLRALVLASGFLITIGPTTARADDASLEFAVKAAFLTKFVPFVDWPGGAFFAPDGTVHICVAGRDPFGDLLNRVADHQLIAGHPVVVLHLTVVSRDNGCQILFAGGSREQSVADMLAVERGTPVLTMTDDGLDAPSRGIINFVIQDNRVRFEIDDRAAAQNGLTISSKLLSLAVRVVGRG